MECPRLGSQADKMLALAVSKSLRQHIRSKPRRTSQVTAAIATLSAQPVNNSGNHPARDI